MSDGAQTRSTQTLRNVQPAFVDFDFNVLSFRTTLHSPARVLSQKSASNRDSDGTVRLHLSIRPSERDIALPLYRLLSFPYSMNRSLVTGARHPEWSLHSSRHLRLSLFSNRPVQIP